MNVFNDPRCIFYTEFDAVAWWNFSGKCTAKKKISHTLALRIDESEYVSNAVYRSFLSRRNRLQLPVFGKRSIDWGILKM